jgi:hypothetical protein
MLSLASAAYTPDKQLVGTFSANLETLEGASPHAETMAWWSTQPEKAQSAIPRWTSSPTPWRC